MSIFKSPQEIAQIRAENERIQQKTISENLGLIDQHAELCKSIAESLDSAISKFDELRAVEDQIHRLGKEPGQIVTAALDYQITGNSSTSKAYAVDARRTIIERNK
jgi:hypothetical protein